MSLLPSFPQADFPFPLLSPLPDASWYLAFATNLLPSSPRPDLSISLGSTVVAATLPFVLATSRPDIRKVSVNIPQGGLPGSPAVSDDPFAAFDEVDRMLEGANVRKLSGWDTYCHVRLDGSDIHVFSLGWP